MVLRLSSFIVVGWLVGCGTSHRPGDPPVPDGARPSPDAGTFVDPPLPPPPPPTCEASCLSVDEMVAGLPEPAATTLRSVVEDEADALHGLVGRYTCDGAVPVYEGTLAVGDDRGDHITAYDNGRIDGDVVGTLDVQWPPPWNGHARLDLRSKDGMHLLLQQAPEDPVWTEASAVEPVDRTVPAHRAGCFGCIPPLPEVPDEVALSPFELEAISGDWRVAGEGHVRRVPPAAVKLDHLAVINDLGEFTPSPEAWRRTRVGTHEVELDEIPAEHADRGFDRCLRVIDYSIRSTIPTACPASHTVDGLSILEETICCERTTFIEDCMCDVPFHTERECF